MYSKKPNVLIVDDEHVVCDLLHEELSKRGYLCTVAYNGNDALAKLAAQPFHAILLDIKLPDISGMEVLSTIHLACRNISVIMLTAVNDVDMAVEAIELGASEYIVKPFDLDKVDHSIRAALRTKECLPTRRDYETDLCLGSEEVKQIAGEYLAQMNAIAFGVEAKENALTGHSKRVTQSTIYIAQQLGIPHEAIQVWATAKEMLNCENNRVIKCAMDKLERSPLAQSMISIRVPHFYTRKPGESNN